MRLLNNRTECIEIIWPELGNLRIYRIEEAQVAHVGVGRLCALWHNLQRRHALDGRRQLSRNLGVDQVLVRLRAVLLRQQLVLHVLGGDRCLCRWRQQCRALAPAWCLCCCSLRLAREARSARAGGEAAARTCFRFGFLAGVGPPWRRPPWRGSVTLRRGVMTCVKCRGVCYAFLGHPSSMIMTY